MRQPLHHHPLEHLDGRGGAGLGLQDGEAHAIRGEGGGEGRRRAAGQQHRDAVIVARHGAHHGAIAKANTGGPWQTLYALLEARYLVKRNRSLGTMKCSFKNLITYFGEKAKAVRLEKKQAKYLEHRRAAGAAEATIRYELSLLDQACGIAVAKKRLSAHARPTIEKPPEDETRMIGRFMSVSRATIKGTLIIGGIQGALGGIAFAVAGIKGAAVWGTIMAMLSAIPGLGHALVWIPVVIYLAATGQWSACIGLLVWCAGVVGSVDNFLRPWLVGKDTELPDVIILVSTLGGLVLFGPLGFIVGPIVAALFVTVWDLYGAAFADLLPPVPEPPAIPTRALARPAVATSVEQHEWSVPLIANELSEESMQRRREILDSRSGEDVKAAKRKGDLVLAEELKTRRDAMRRRPPGSSVRTRMVAS